MSAALPRLGAILDRAAHILISKAGAVAICMGPAVVLGIAFASINPHTFANGDYFSVNDNAGPFFREYGFFSAATAIVAFCQWLCALSLMVGVGRYDAVRPSHPLSWLGTTLRRSPSLLICLLPIVPALVSTTLAMTAYSEFAEAIRGLHRLDSTSLMFQLAAAPYEMIGGIVLAALGLPLAYIAAASVQLAKTSTFRAVAESIRSSFSQKLARNYLALSFAIFGLIAAQGFIDYLITLPAQRLAWTPLVWSALQTSIDTVSDAYVAIVVTVAWLGGFVGPEPHPRTSPVTAERTG